MVSLKEYWEAEKALMEFHKACKENDYYGILRAHIKYRVGGVRVVVAIYHAWDFFTERELQFIKEFAENRGMVVEYHESDPGIPWKPSVDIYFPKERDDNE